MSREKDTKDIVAIVVSVFSLGFSALALGVSWYYDGKAEDRATSVDISGFEAENGAVAEGAPVQIFLRNEGLRDVESVALEFKEKLVSLTSLSGEKLDLESGGMETLTLDPCELGYLSAGKELGEGDYFTLLTGEGKEGTRIDIGPRAQETINNEIESLNDDELCSNGEPPVNEVIFPDIKSDE